METAPKDGTAAVELLSRNFGRRGQGTTVYRAVWARKAGKWLNLDNLNEELCYAIRWRPAPDDVELERPFTEEEEDVLAELHSEPGDRLIPFGEFLRREQGS